MNDEVKSLLQEEPMTIAEVGERMRDVRDERRRIAEQDKLLNEEWYALEGILMAKLDDQGMKRVTVEDVGTFTITETVVPNVSDWDEFYEYVLEQRAPHMFQRRVSTAAFRELHDAGESVPGVDAYNKRTISLRKR